MRALILAASAAILAFGGTALAQGASSHEAAFHAPPGAADCIWAAAPAAVHDAVGAATSIDDLTLAESGFDQNDGAPLAVMAIKCRVADLPGAPAKEVVQHVIIAKTMEIWAGNRLKFDYDVADEKVAAAWAAQSPAARAAFAGWMRDSLQVADAPAALKPLVDQLGLTGDDSSKLVLFYAAARALFEQMGGTN
jgi:hypothetical protein